MQMDLGVVEPESGDSLAGEPGAASRAQSRLCPVLKTGDLNGAKIGMDREWR